MHNRARIMNEMTMDICIENIYERTKDVCTSAFSYLLGLFFIQETMEPTCYLIDYKAWP